MIFPSTLLVGKTVTINSTSVTVTQCEHYEIGIGTLVNGIYEISYYQFQQLCGLTDSQLVTENTMVIPSITAFAVIAANAPLTPIIPVN